MPKSLKNFKIVGDGVGRCQRDEQKTFKEARKSSKNFEMALVFQRAWTSLVYTGVN
jgi:hypothetical protein